MIPETIDAIRAITGIVENANESIAKTNTALGICPVINEEDAGNPMSRSPV